MVAEQAAGRRLEADADVALGTVYQRMGRTAEAIDHLRRALALAREIESPAAEGEALLGLGAAYFDARDVDEALRCAEAAHAAAQRAGHLLREGHALTLLAQVGLALGQPDQVVEHAGTALKIHAAVPYPLAESQARATLADALRLQER